MLLPFCCYIIEKLPKSNKNKMKYQRRLFPIFLDVTVWCSFLLVISRLLTVDIYGHLIPGSNREAFNRLDEMQPSEITLKTKGATH
jgi:hypothetical protein